jgi:hypothetical protein
VRRHAALAALWFSGAAFWILFAFVRLAFAQESYTYFRHYDFSGGVNYSTSPYLLADNEAADILNMRVARSGAVEKRNGYTLHSAITGGTSETNFPISLFRYYGNAGTGTWLCHAGTSVYAFDETFSTWSAITSGVSIRQSAWANLLGRAYFTNEADGLMEWDGTTWTAIPGAPKCRYIAAHNQRLYLSGRDGAPTTIFYSGLRNGRIWDDVSLAAANAGYWTIVTPDNSAITGFAPWQGYLAIFTNSAIMALVGAYPAEQSFTTVSSQIGCTAPRSIARVGDSAAFKYLDHVYLLNSPPQKISVKLGNELSGCTNSVCVVRGDSLWITDPGEDEIMEDTDEVFVYDLQFQRWTRWDDIPASCFGVAAANGEDTLLFGDRAFDRVLEWDETVYSDALGRNTRGYVSYTGQYPAYYTTKRWSFGAPEIDKVFRHVLVDLYGSSGSLRCEYDIDYGRISGNINSRYSTGEILDSFVLDESQLGGAEGSTLRSPLLLNDVGKTIQIRFYNEEPGDELQILGLVLRLRPKQFRGEE